MGPVQAGCARHRGVWEKAASVSLSSSSKRQQDHRENPASSLTPDPGSWIRGHSPVPPASVTHEPFVTELLLSGMSLCELDCVLCPRVGQALVHGDSRESAGLAAGSVSSSSSLTCAASTI